MRRLYSAIGLLSLSLASACAETASNETSLGAATQALSSASTVMGFESASAWTASAGVVGTTADSTTGDAALTLTDFTYSEVVSTPLSTPSAISSTLLVDVKAPVPLAWGFVQLFLSSPTAGLHNQFIGQRSLTGTTANSYSTLAFDLPRDIVTKLTTQYSDLTIKFVLNVPYTTVPYQLDSLRFQETSPSVVEMMVDNVDDWVSLSVDGVERKEFYCADPENGVIRDVSDWFARGNNDVRIYAMNTGGPSSCQVKFWVDGALVINEACDASLAADDDAKVGIVLDKTVSLYAPNRPAAQTVTVTAPTRGKIYVNDRYVGKSTPATLTLPVGDYVFGVGVSTDVPPAYTGSFYEKTVSVGTSSVLVDMAGVSALPSQETKRIAIVPIRNTYNYVPSLGGPDVSNDGVLFDEEISRFVTQVKATGEKWVKPFSYGLSTWTVDLKPTVEAIPMNEERADQFEPEKFIKAARLTGLYDKYDYVILLFSQHRADGSDVDDGAGISWVFGTKGVAISTTFTNGFATGMPNFYVLHETLHHAEAYNDDVLHHYNGISGLHGGEIHGYACEGSSGELDFVKAYRVWMRGQMAELDGMSEDVHWPTVPATGDLYVGVFPPIRHGFN
jgi:hypothetical protein